MSKAVATIESNEKGAESIQWLSPFTPSIGAELYTTDHAEELAKALEELMSIVTIHQNATVNNFAWAETDCAQEALTNYREATGQN